MDLVTAVMPRPSPVERRARLAELLAAMAATGLTGAHVVTPPTRERAGFLCR
ncbi:hypothetical protein GCM10023080_077470 [Streptomyces pseudoechinosporeus]